MHQYYTDKFPSVDPEEVTLAQLSDYSITSAEDEIDFFSFPNEKLLSLTGIGLVQNLLQSFKDLIGIVGHTNFDPDNVHQTKWDKINQILDDNIEEGQEGEWVDDNVGWKTTQLRYKYLFTNACKVQACMSTRQQTTTTLVGVIKEHITDPRMASQFHSGSRGRIFQRLDFTAKYTLPTLFLRNTRLCKSLSESLGAIFHVIIGCIIYSDQTHLTA